MKSLLKYTLLLLGPAVLLLSGCELEQAPEWDEPAPLSAGIEPSAEVTADTKTSYDSEVGKFIWSEGDQIAIHYSNGEYVTGTLEADGTEGYKKVSVTAPEGKSRDFYAVYPATAAVADNYGNPVLQVTFPASYDISAIVNGSGSFEESRCPMVAVNNPAKTELDFYHVGGLLRMKMSLLDQNSAFVRFTFDKDVTGDYAVANPTTATPTFTTQGSAANNVVTVTLNNSQGIGYRSYDTPFYVNVPVPCGTYSNIKVEILDASNRVQESATIPRLRFERHHGKRVAFIQFHDRDLPPAYLPGKFSVSDTKSVYFAKGNILVTHTNVGGQAHREWLLTEHQWDNYTDAFPSSFPVPEGTTYHQSYFSWGTGDRPQNVLLKSSDNEDYSDFVDWGIHFDDNGFGSDAYTEGTWYTLSSEEWLYLCRTGHNAETHVGRAEIYDPVSQAYIRGIVVMPDSFSMPPESVTFQPGNTVRNRYSAGDPSMGTDGLWSDMEAMGAVFLPYCGSLVRDGNGVRLQGVGSYGYYWASNPLETSYAYCVAVDRFAMSGVFRAWTRPVRLVHN